MKKNLLITVLLFVLFTQVKTSQAEELKENKFCLIYSLSSEYSTTNELDDCNSNLSEINKELGFIKKIDSITSLDSMKDVTLDSDTELVSCEKKLISKIEELENLRRLFGADNIKEITFLKKESMP